MHNWRPFCQLTLLLLNCQIPLHKSNPKHCLNMDQSIEHHLICFWKGQNCMKYKDNKRMKRIKITWMRLRCAKFETAPRSTSDSSSWSFWCSICISKSLKACPRLIFGMLTATERTLFSFCSAWSCIEMLFRIHSRTFCHRFHRYPKCCKF